MKDVAVGTEHRITVLPTDGDLASSIGNPGVHVVSTPALITYIETVCQELVAPACEPGEATVGTMVNVRHLKAADGGASIECTARFVGRVKRRVRFEAEARQHGEVVMSGEHERAVVELGRFLQDTSRADPETTTSLRSITFWFDVHSPWVYLAAQRIGDIARRRSVAIRWRPLQLPRLIDAIGGRRPLEESAAFVRWYRQDLSDWAALQGLPLRYHPDYPLRNARALRVCLYADSQGKAEPFTKRLLSAYWSEAQDITDPAVLGQLAAEAGLDEQAARDATSDARLKDQLEANTREAIERGVFGVPTIDVGDKLYFGNDRLELMEKHLVEHSQGEAAAS